MIKDSDYWSLTNEKDMFSLCKKEKDMFFCIGLSLTNEKDRFVCIELSLTNENDRSFVSDWV